MDIEGRGIAPSRPGQGGIAPSRCRVAVEMTTKPQCDSLQTLRLRVNREALSCVHALAMEVGFKAQLFLSF